MTGEMLSVLERVFWRADLLDLTYLQQPTIQSTRVNRRKFLTIPGKHCCLVHTQCKRDAELIPVSPIAGRFLVSIMCSKKWASPAFAEIIAWRIEPTFLGDVRYRCSGRCGCMSVRCLSFCADVLYQPEWRHLPDAVRQISNAIIKLLMFHY